MGGSWRIDRASSTDVQECCRCSAAPSKWGAIHTPTTTKRFSHRHTFWAPSSDFSDLGSTRSLYKRTTFVATERERADALKGAACGGGARHDGKNDDQPESTRRPDRTRLLCLEKEKIQPTTNDDVPSSSCLLFVVALFGEW